MPTKILVTYTTNSGSTREVAEAVATGLGTDGVTTEVIHTDKVQDLAPYGAIVIGGPMILGWHRGAINFLKKHQKSLSRIPVAYFFTAMSLTTTRETQLEGIPIYIDPGLGKCPQISSFRERYATVKRYLGPVLQQTPQIRPISAAFFAGKMDYSRLKWPQFLFVKLVIGAKPGDRRNWGAIREWAAGLHTPLT